MWEGPKPAFGAGFYLYTYIVSFGHFSSWYKLVIGEPTKIIPYTMMFLGAYMLVLGIEKLKKEKFIHRVHSSCRWDFYVSYQAFSISFILFVVSLYDSIFNYSLAKI
ncbi:hypothetical protein [Halobacillus karajensis]|uniref:Uncharacterized protein n=1 Tax=Halobacillus karajensis TaxID=195088 RepID=A0A024P863_9BACI|nr:hypothetical protein [Halobacillus karajensis]CDQ20053.1 hypothetical protein BN982_02366 [Halobacillus karajensis]CDQ25284.1 hypothetical protein BN983_03599 [Halobacillus karajensis]CDQ28355.1 hypothetical protein BN981_02653 [Halobacillus karajensis]